MNCQASTTKKAWNNPLAPMAKCTHEAKAEVAYAGQYPRPNECVCAIHLKKRLERGWKLVRMIDSASPYHRALERP
jgi:hypothetical protein